MGLFGKPKDERVPHSVPPDRTICGGCGLEVTLCGNCFEPLCACMAFDRHLVNYEWQCDGRYKGKLTRYDTISAQARYELNRKYRK